MAKMAKRRTTKKDGGEDKSSSVPQAPEGKESLLDKAGRYAVYGQIFGNDSANMSMGQRIGGAAYSAFEQATLGQMGTLGKAMSAGISSRGKGDTRGGTGVDTQEIQFQQIKGDEVVGAINQSTRQVVSGLNSVNNTLGRGFNGMNDRLQAQGQALDSIVASNEDVAIQMRELYEQLNKMAYDRGGQGGANASTLAGRPTPNDGITTPNKGGGGLLGGLLGDVLTGAAAAGGAGLLRKLFGKDGAKTAEKGLGKTALKSILKKIPGIGLLMGLGFGIGRLMEGDILGAAGEVASGAASMIPGVGTAASVAIDAGLLAKDVSEANKEDAQQRPPEGVTSEGVTPPFEKEKEQYAFINDPGIAGQEGILGKPGPNHGVRVKLVKKVANGWIVEYPNGQQSFTGDNTISNTSPQSSLGNEKGVKVASLNSTTMTDATPVGISALTSVESSLGATLKAPGETSEGKLKQQEAAAESAQKKTIAENLTINANEMTFKADKIVFDTSSLEFNYDKKTMQEKEKAPKTDSGASPASRLQGGVTPGSEAEAAGSPSSVTPGGAPGPMPKLEALDAGKARENAEKYLGRKMSDQEYDYLMRATHAEAGAGQQADPREQAMIMASILNRAREMGDDGVIKALTAENQFQAVTGTKYKPGPSANFTQGPDAKRQESIETSSQMLGSIPQEQKNFTAASSDAYGAGTNIGYRDKMVAAGGTQMGGSVFNTNPNFENTAPATAAPAAPESVGGEQGTQQGADQGKNAAKVVEAYGGNRPGRPEQRVINLAQQSATKAGMPSVTLTSGKGNWISPAGKANGQKTTMHSTGLAVDIGSESFKSPEQKHAFIASAKAGGAGGVGVYKDGSVHIDYGKDRSWNWGDPDQKGFQNALNAGASGATPGSAPAASADVGSAPMAIPSSDAAGMSGGLSGGGGGSNPLAAMLGGGGSPFGMASALLGPLIGGMSKNASLTAAAPKAQAPSTNIVNNSKSAPNASGSNGPNPGQPQPAISSMFAKLFEGSAMFG